MPRWLTRWLSFRVVLAAGLALLTVLTVRQRFYEPDLWFHLKLGQIIWNTRSIPSTDLFSYTVYGHSWTAHEWLADLTIYLAYQMGGYSGLMLWMAVGVTLIVFLIYLLCYRETKSGFTALLGGLCTWYFSTVGLAVRPLVLGYLFLAVELVILDLFLHTAWPRRRWLLFLLPPLFVTWVNCHGSYLFGLGVLAALWVCSFATIHSPLIVAKPWEPARRRFLTWIVLLSVAALSCNPVGPRLLLYPFNVAFRQTTSLAGIDEWLPPDLLSARGLGMLAVLAVIAGVTLWRRTPLRLFDVLVLSMGSFLAFQHVRMLFVFGIVASPVLCRTLAPLLGADRKREQPLANAVLLLVIAAILVAAFPSSAALQGQVAKSSPAGAIAYIRSAGLSGPMLNEYAFGGYLIWAMPEEKVFIDGRGDVYDWTGILAEYGRWATLGEDPALLLDKHRIRLCLISQNSPMSRALPHLLGWHEVYRDGIAVVFVR